MLQCGSFTPVTVIECTGHWTMNQTTQRQSSPREVLRLKVSEAQVLPQDTRVWVPRKSTSQREAEKAQARGQILAVLEAFLMH
ncbi:TPA: hypothetical protein ACH3X2_006649 [Trebouxia sp. C0005]